MSTIFTIDTEQGKDALLVLKGLDSDNKPGSSRVIEIRVNEKTVFSGPNGASKTDWTKLEFKIPKAILKKGQNSLKIKLTDTSGCFLICQAKVKFK